MPGGKGRPWTRAPRPSPSSRGVGSGRGLRGAHLRPVVDLDEHGARVRVVGAPLADAAAAGAPEGPQGRGAQLGAQQLLHGWGPGTRSAGREQWGARGASSPLPRPLPAGEAPVRVACGFGAGPASRPAPSLSSPAGAQARRTPPREREAVSDRDRGGAAPSAWVPMAGVSG